MPGHLNDFADMLYYRPFTAEFVVVVGRYGLRVVPSFERVESVAAEEATF